MHSHILYALPHMYNKMEDLISGIYKITNPEGRIYIGCSKNIVKRKYYYKNNKLTHQSLIRESIIKFGWGNHIFEIIEYTTQLRDQERYWIKYYNSYNFGLNKNNGGGGVIEHSQNAKNILSKKSIQRYKDPIMGEKLRKSFTRKGIPSHRKGKPLPESHKNNMQGINKGIPKPTLCKPIIQYDLDGNYINEHPSIEEAAKILNLNPTAINNALRKGFQYSSGGFRWKYKNQI